MSMHLCPVFITTTNSRKRKSKLTDKQKLKLEAHQRWVESITKGKKADKKLLDKMFKVEYNDYMSTDRSTSNKTGIVSGVCSKPETKTYSGERKLIGIATMHKSNIVPVFEKKDAEDIAKMRRS